MTVEEQQQQQAFQTLQARLKEILPPEYQDNHDDVEPVSMGSAGLKFASDARVAWDKIWGSFCDLAMAGGPPHKGLLLEPGSAADIQAQPERYQQVVEEICRGIHMVSGLTAKPAPTPGWVRIQCSEAGMAEWLVRAIVMENVSAHLDGNALDLPAGPRYRLEKEIKNVVTAIAKTTHYWLGHTMPEQARRIATLFVEMREETALIQPALATSEGIPADHYQTLCTAMSNAIEQQTGLPRAAHGYTGWLGVECPSVKSAIWMMRALVVSNVLARREETALFVAVNPGSDPHGAAVVQAVSRVYGFAKAQEIL